MMIKAELTHYFREHKMFQVVTFNYKDHHTGRITRTEIFVSMFGLTAQEAEEVLRYCERQETQVELGDPRVNRDCIDLSLDHVSEEAVAWVRARYPNEITPQWLIPILRGDVDEAEEAANA